MHLPLVIKESQAPGGPISPVGNNGLLFLAGVMFNGFQPGLGRDHMRKKGWKALYGASFALAVAVVVLFLLGGRMYTYEVAETMEATPEEVFRHLTEPTLLTQWIGGLVSSTPLTEGGLRVGARSAEVVEEGGRRAEMETTVVQLEPGRYFESTISADSLEALAKYSLTFEDGQTRVDYVLEARYKGVLMRCMAPFLGPVIRKKLSSDLGRLKLLVERGSES